MDEFSLPIFCILPDEMRPRDRERRNSRVDSTHSTFVIGTCTTRKLTSIGVDRRRSPTLAFTSFTILRCTSVAIGGAHWCSRVPQCRGATQAPAHHTECRRDIGRTTTVQLTVPPAIELSLTSLRSPQQHSSGIRSV